MKSYDESMVILEAFYNECVDYWKMRKSKVPEMSAIQDIVNLKHDPFTPDGGEINSFAKMDFIDSKL